MSEREEKTMTQIQFPKFSGARCLMMPYIQGDARSVPAAFAAYRDIIESVSIERGQIGFLTIDESIALEGSPHRGARAKYGRALHTEAGKIPGMWCWGGSTNWGGKKRVTLDRDVQILLANNADDTCALWECEHENTSEDGDIGFAAKEYPYSTAVMMKAGEVRQIGILTPHESLPVERTIKRQFLRIVSSGVHGREEYFTHNPLMAY